MQWGFPSELTRKLTQNHSFGEFGLQTHFARSQDLGNVLDDLKTTLKQQKIPEKTDGHILIISWLLGRAVPFTCVVHGVIVR